MKYGNVFWGILLIIAGALFALRNFNVIDFDWWSLMKLWPLAIVLLGISFLPVKSGVKVLFSVIIILVATVLIIRYPGSRFRLFERSETEWRSQRSDKTKKAWKEQHFTESFDSSVHTAKINLDISAGKFRLKDHTDMLFRFDHEGDTEKYMLDIDENKGYKEITLSLGKSVVKRKLKSASTLMLHKDPLWDIGIDAAATTTHIDISPFRVANFEMDGAASDISLKLGSLHPETKVNIDAAVSALDLMLPREAAIELNTSTVLSHKDFKGFNKIDKGLYRTSEFRNDMPQIIITIDAAVSSVNVSFY